MSLGGLYKQQQIAFAGLAKVFAGALIAELILLAFLYERFWAAHHHHRQLRCSPPLRSS